MYFMEFGIHKPTCAMRKRNTATVHPLSIRIRLNLCCAPRSRHAPPFLLAIHITKVNDSLTTTITCGLDRIALPVIVPNRSHLVMSLSLSKGTRVRTVCAKGAPRVGAAHLILRAMWRGGRCRRRRHTTSHMTITSIQLFCLDRTDSGEPMNYPRASVVLWRRAFRFSSLHWAMAVSTDDFLFQKERGDSPSPQAPDASSVVARQMRVVRTQDSFWCALCI